MALAVAAIPEGLPIVATLALALARGMWRMARQNSLIERLSRRSKLWARPPSSSMTRLAR